MLSKSFINAIGCLLFIGGMTALVYLVGGFIEGARTMIQLG